MPSPDELIEDLRSLSPTQLGAAAAYLKGLREGTSFHQQTVRTFAATGAPLAYQPPPDMFLSVNADDLRIEKCDQAMLDLLGRNPVGKPFVDLIDSEYQDSARHAFEVVRGHQTIRNVALRILRVNADSLSVTISAHLVDKPAGTPALIDIVCRDTSDLRRMDNIEAFSEMLSVGIMLVDENGRIAYANSQAETMFGYEPSELNHQPMEILIPAALRETHANHKTEFFRRPDARIMASDRELSGIKKDGSEIALQIGLSSVRLGDRRLAVASITDLTERKRIEHALRKHEEQRALIFSEGLLGDFTWNIERDELEAHPTVFKLYGAAPIAGPVSGDWFRSRQHPEDRLDVQEKWLSQIAAGHDVAVEFRVNGDDGVTRWIDCRAIVVRDAQGVARVVHGLNIDITARKQAELERRESEARARRAEDRLRTAVQFSVAAVWRWYPSEDATEWFGPVFELTGKRPEDLMSFVAFKEIVFPADRQPLEEAVAKCYALGGVFRHEFRIVRPDGEVRWLAGRGNVLRDSAGRVYGMTGVNFDITDRKNVEAELSQSERDFRELTNVIPQIVFTANPSGAIEYRNERHFEISGFADDVEAKQRSQEILNPEDLNQTMQAWRDGIASGQPFELEYQIRDQRLQECRWYLARAVPVRNAEGAIVRWIGTSTDIHDQKTAAERLEREVQSRTSDLNESLNLLREREEQLEKSLREKDALLREIHHRVKNNLQVVSSLLNMQATNAGDSAAVAPLRDSERRIASMAMIHEQLYSTDDMQTLEFAEHAHSLSQRLLVSMAGSSLVTCRLDVRPVNLSIHQAIPAALILNELLTNAFKYAYPNSGGGEITVALSSDRGLVTMMVSDQGVGLPSDVDPFQPKTLGLEIVQVLVSQLEGQLIVEGPPGAAFSVRFRVLENSSEGENIRSTAPAWSRN